MDRGGGVEGRGPATGSSPIAAVVFDLDGTLIDSRADIAQAVNVCLRAAGVSPRSEEEIGAFIGDGSRWLLQRASGWSREDPRLDALLEQFLAYYTAHAVEQTVLLPGAREVLEQLGHLPRALCTNKPRLTTLAVLEGLGIARAFDVVVAAGDAPFNKPHPAPLLRVSELLAVPAERLVLVGDGPQDVACARAANARSIGITDAIIVPLERLLAARPDRAVALRDVPALIDEWQRTPASA